MKKLTKHKCERHGQRQTTELTAPDMGQSHKKCDLVQHVCERSTLPYLIMISSEIS